MMALDIHLSSGRSLFLAMQRVRTVCQREHSKRVMQTARIEATFLFLPSLSLQSDIPLPGLGEGVERREKGEGVRSLIGGAGEGVGVGELVGDGHPEITMGV